MSSTPIGTSATICSSRWHIDAKRCTSWRWSILDRYFDRQQMEYVMGREDGGSMLLMPKRPDAYNSSRILESPNSVRAPRTELGAELAVGVPSRDFIVAVSMGQAEALSEIRRKVEDDFNRMDHPLSPRLLLSAPTV